MTTAALRNPHLDLPAVPAPDLGARGFHEALPGYTPTPVHRLGELARELGVATVGVKDESRRLGLPAFKILGASWAIERTLREQPGVTRLVAASAGNHGRAVARAAALRGLAARIHLPARSSPARRAAIAGEGAEVVVVDGSYEDAVQRAREDALDPDAAEIADVGSSGPAHWVTDGYATLFGELTEPWDIVLVPTGVGSLAAAAARYGRAAGAVIVAVEPDAAACLTASLAAGHPVAVPTPGTSMAGLDCAEVSPAAWATLRAGIHATVTVSDGQTHAAMRELHGAGLRIGDCGAAPLAALRAVAGDDGERAALGLGPDARVLLVATEGPTDPEAYARICP